MTEQTGGDDEFREVVGPEGALLGTQCAAGDLVGVGLIEKARVEFYVLVARRRVNGPRYAADTGRRG